ncbi:hypothetical protein SOCEGT47_010750 [Sorangium cellulosum]|uniref:Uncharacterized protein n=1 Tax=Sorangium cellulosum TaxID=56 RepID=A0A4P2PVV6_SORCE|nr:hypothetical protein [Sorangium cellulosum]AUX20603.1 hypothetical protein SOCEGT47_010750 [Sorangium cellulosum]
MRVDVACRAGHGGCEEPQALTLGERRVRVTEILDRWPGVDHLYFKVLGDDGARYILRRDLEIPAWELEVYEAAEGSPVWARGAGPLQG